MDIQISIIIVNYNTEEVLEKCLASIRNQVNNIGYEVIVVDNNSEKGSLANLVSAFPEVNFMFLEKNLGFGMGNNAGAAMARGKYLYLLNPDTVLVNNAPYILHRYLEDKNHSQVAICNASMYSPDMQPTSTYGNSDILLLEYKKLLNMKTHQRGINRTGKPVRVKELSGANFFIRKKVFDEVGGFDKDFFMYYEEIDLCDRVRRKGYYIVSVPEAKIVHSYGASAENKNETMRQWSREEHWYSKFVYFFKTKGKYQTALLYQANMLKLHTAVFFYSLQKNKSKLDYWNAKKQVIQKTYSRYKSYLNSKK